MEGQVGPVPQGSWSSKCSQPCADVGRWTNGRSDWPYSSNVTHARNFVLIIFFEHALHSPSLKLMTAKVQNTPKLKCFIPCAALYRAPMFAENGKAAKSKKNTEARDQTNQNKPKKHTQRHELSTLVFQTVHMQSNYLQNCTSIIALSNLQKRFCSFIYKRFFHTPARAV